jgi:glyoxylase-like metal-dependent hydrolase (beta-lactamase superfamily II)
MGLFGPGTKAYCSPGHFVNAETQWDGRFFDQSGYATEDCAELSGPWVRWGSFEKAMDFFGDGSFWVIQAPGHMPGNLCAAVWVDVQGKSCWIILAGDCCHSR